MLGQNTSKLPAKAEPPLLASACRLVQTDAIPPASTLARRLAVIHTPAACALASEAHVSRQRVTENTMADAPHTRPAVFGSPTRTQWDPRSGLPIPHAESTSGMVDSDTCHSCQSASCAFVGAKEFLGRARAVGLRKTSLAQSM